MSPLDGAKVCKGAVPNAMGIPIASLCPSHIPESHLTWLGNRYLFLYFSDLVDFVGGDEGS